MFTVCDAISELPCIIHVRFMAELQNFPEHDSQRCIMTDLNFPKSLITKLMIINVNVYITN